MRPHTLFPVLVALLAPAASGAQEPDAHRFQPMDVFHLEWAGDPRISPDGRQVVYVRSGNDVLKDRSQGNLWIVDWDGSRHRPLTDQGAGSPRWSPDGSRLAYVAGRGEHGAEIHLRWMDTGQTAVLTQLDRSPSGLSWSPDGEWIAFTMFVPDPQKSPASTPSPPRGADWGPSWRYIDEIQYRADGASGFIEPGHTHVFVVPSEGGAARQLTSGPYDHGGTPEWSRDGRHVLISANRRDDADYEPLDSEIYEVAVADGAIRALTDRYGPDSSPLVSPDGSRIAYLGFDDRHQGYQISQLYVMARDGSGSRLVSGDFDRSVGNPVWSGDSRGLFFQYGDRGEDKVAYISLEGEVTEIASDVGGLSLGRPYVAGQFTATPGGRFAFTMGTSEHPADLAVVERGGEPRRLTRLNRDLFGHKELGTVEEIWWESSHDGRRIQGWIMKPPGFDPSERYPMILEIHGGPFAMYGDVFSAELQLMAAAGYVVFYTNPRGSTGYGAEFGNLIHHAYPGNDYDDLMSGVDALLERGYVDPDHLYVTGGSGGGVLSAWIVGKTDRFRAAVVQKPVINWYSFVLHADNVPFFYKYWFPGLPWEHQEHYMDRSPISLVGDVTTPTMLMVGDEDYRTPASESEQYYAALKLRKVPSALVRVPDASHGIASKPSNLVAKVAHILAWFEEHDGDDESPMAEGGGRYTLPRAAKAATTGADHRRARGAPVTHSAASACTGSTRLALLPGR